MDSVNVQCSVRVNGRLTEWFKVGCGLKQGCSLSSMLFNLYINDLIENINALNMGIDIDGQKIGMLVYADDVVLLTETEDELQYLLNELNRWCDINKLEVNASKSKVVHFRTPSKAKTGWSFTCGEKYLETVDQYLYLGLLLTEHLDYAKMAKQVSNSASRALGLLISKSKLAGGLTFSTYSKLYDSTVASIIGYGAAVWGCRQFSCIDAVQNRALRFFLGVGRYAPNAAVNGDTGWQSVFQRQWHSITNQWHRTKRMNPNRMNYKLYQWGVYHGNNRHKNWAYRVKQMLEESGIGNLFETNVANISKRYVKEKVIGHIKTQEHDKWLNELSRVNARRGNGQNKLRTYRTFKTEYKEENYVKILLPLSHRSALAKFRMGIAPIRIETGRYEQLPVNERICF